MATRWRSRCQGQFAFFDFYVFRLQNQLCRHEPFLQLIPCGDNLLIEILALAAVMFQLDCCRHDHVAFGIRRRQLLLIARHDNFFG